MAHQGFAHFASAVNGNIDPNDLAMTGAYSSFANVNQNFHAPGHAAASAGFSSGSAVFDDDELLDGLASPSDGHGNMHGQSHDFSGMNMAFSHGSYNSHRASGVPMNASHLANGFSNTPDGEPIQSPYSAAFNPHFRHMHAGHAMGASLHSPAPYTPSPMPANDMPPKTANIHAIPIGSHGSPNFASQPMRATASHEKSPSAQWVNTPTGSIPASYNSGFSSPLQPGVVPINEVMLKGGSSMPAKLGVPPNTVSTQEMKRKRRHESHNLVERRRRDNINERIQDLSKFVPTHRLEDEKIRKLMQNGTPLSPTLTAMASPSQATSGLAGPGARRATGVSTGSITTGLPVDGKDKGPNKGDILNGAVSWTGDLMWMLQLKLQQQEELMNTIVDLGGRFPFELTDDERRMQTELMDALSKNDTGSFSYTRTAGSGLRVPTHTDFRGDPVTSLTANLDSIGISPEHHQQHQRHLDRDFADAASFWPEPDDDSAGHPSLDFKAEDDYGMDLTH